MTRMPARALVQPCGRALLANSGSRSVSNLGKVRHGDIQKDPIPSGHQNHAGEGTQNEPFRFPPQMLFGAMTKGSFWTNPHIGTFRNRGHILVLYVVKINH